MIGDLQREARRKVKATGRDADPRRTLPLNSHKWRKLRAYILEESPLCEHCIKRGETVPATDVDHVDGNPGNNSMANLQSLCHSCHSTKTAADHGKRVARPVGLDGLPLTGPWAVTAKDCEAEPVLDRPVPSLQTLTAKKERDG